jgi:hypothetical protein
VCRCGSERRRLETLGYEFSSEPEFPTTLAPKLRAQSSGLTGTLVGYQLDTNLGAEARFALKALFAIAVLSVGVALVLFTHTEPSPSGTISRF